MNCLGNSSIQNDFRIDELPGNSLMEEITRKSGRRSPPVSQDVREAQAPDLQEVRGARLRARLRAKLRGRLRARLRDVLRPMLRARDVLRERLRERGSARGSTVG